MSSLDPALRRRHSKEEWRQLVNEFHASGLSHQQFCSSRGIGLSRLERWIPYFHRESQPQPVSPFVDLGAMDHTPVSPSLRLELHLDLGGGVVMTLSRA